MGRPVAYEVNAFEGMYHSLDGQTPKPEIPWFLENLVAVNGVLISRPGFVDGAQVATPAVGQGLGQFMDSGTERLIAVAGGEIYSFESGPVWTRRVTTANLATASITFSTTARVYLTQLGEYLHFTDGTNVPFMWDGAAGAGGLTSLTNSPVLYGQPTVYYGKLFGIKNTDRQMIVWSEENAMQTGYEAGGYTNRWSLTQTGGGKLWAIRGTNEALYYWRGSNTGAINGEVGSNFTTTGVHDAVSMERGTLATQTTVGYDGVWFYDELYRPAVIKGGRVVDLWPQIASAMRAAVSTAVSQPYRPASNSFTHVVTDTGTPCGISTYPSLDAVIFWYQRSDAGLLGIVFNGRTNRAISYFTVDTAAVSGTGVTGVATLESTGVVFVMTTSTARVGALASAVDLGNQTAQTADAFGGATATNPAIRFVGARMGVSRDMNQHFDTLSVETEIESTAVSTIGIQYLTSQVQKIASMGTALTVTPTVDTKEKHVVGIAGYGRWIAPAITVNHAATTARAPVRFYGVKVDGFTDAADLSTS